MDSPVTFHVQVDPQQVNQTVAEAVLKSTLGEAIKKAVEENTKYLLNKSWDNPVEKVIKEVITQEIRRLVAEEYAEAIRQRVKALVTDQMVERLTGELWDKVIEIVKR